MTATAGGVQTRAGIRETSPRARREGSIATPLAFMTPALLAFTLFVVVPAIAGLVLAFFDWDLFGTPEFVGIDTFARLLTDPDMWQSLFVTLSFVVLGVIPTVLLGFILAVLINTNLPGIFAVRVFYFAPMIASSAVAALIWATLYSPQYGLVNRALSLIGITGPDWLSDLFWARPALVIIMIWGALPLVIILYLAGLQRVPEDIYAAASLDGAGRWRQLWSMTWPNVRPTTLLVLVLQGLGFISGSFEIALILTDGGPLGRTRSLALYAYQEAFDQRDIGYASALSFFQLLLLAVVIAAGRGIAKIVRRRSR